MPANPDKLKVVKEYSRREILLSMARQPGSSRIFCGGSEFKVYDLDLSAEKPEPKEMAGHGSYVMGVARVGDEIVTGSYDRHLIWWNTTTHEQLRKVKAHDKWIRGVVASPDEKLVASVADDMVCRLWDPASGKPIRELRGHKPQTPQHYPSMLYACTFSPDGKLLATGDKVGHVVVWEAATGKQVATLESPENYTWDPRQRRHSIGGIRSLAFSPDGKLLAVGGIAKIGNIDHLGGKALVQVYDWASGERKHKFEHGKHNGLIEQLRFHHQGDWLLGAGGANKGLLLFMSLKDNKFIRDSEAKMHIHAIELSEDSETLYAVGNGNAIIWEMKG